MIHSALLPYFRSCFSSNFTSQLWFVIVHNLHRRTVVIPVSKWTSSYLISPLYFLISLPLPFQQPRGIKTYHMHRDVINNENTVLISNHFRSVAANMRTHFRLYDWLTTRRTKTVRWAFRNASSVTAFLILTDFALRCDITLLSHHHKEYFALRKLQVLLDF